MKRGDAFNTNFPGIWTIPTTGPEVKFIILALKAQISKRCGGIRSKVLKVISSLISQPLTHICDHSAFTEIFPDFVKNSEVRLLYKTGDKQ
jgi:hypothetical protein